MTYRAAGRQPLRAAALLLALVAVLAPVLLALTAPSASAERGQPLRVGSDLTYPPSSAGASAARRPRHGPPRHGDT